MNPDVLKALGLAEGAAAADAVAAIEKLKTDQQLALNRAQHPDPAAWVPRADHQLALNRIGAFEAEARARADKDAEAAVDAAIAEGKIAPASREYHLATCRAEGGLGAIPARVSVHLICVNAGPSSAGYAVGDVIEVAPGADPDGSAEGISILKSATTLVVRIGGNGPTEYINKNSGSGHILKAADWAMQIRAYKD